jgi:hypothetical protein
LYDNTGDVIHQYRTTKFPSIFTGEAMAVLKTLEIISDSQGESICVCFDTRSVLRCLNERSLTLNINPQNKRKTTGTKET